MDDFKRREFIKLSALGFASIALQLNSISTYAQSANAHHGKWNKNTKLNWDAFLARLTQLAKAQRLHREAKAALAQAQKKSLDPDVLKAYHERVNAMDIKVQQAQARFDNSLETP